MCFILDHLLCPDCGTGVLENARRHCEQTEERVGRRRNLISLRVDTIGDGEAAGIRKASRLMMVLYSIQEPWRLIVIKCAKDLVTFEASRWTIIEFWRSEPVDLPLQADLMAAAR